MFESGKPKEEVSSRSKELLRQAITSVNVNTDDYTVVYGYFMKSGLMSKKMNNYAIGLSKDKSNLIIVQIDSNGNTREVTNLSISDIQSAKVNMQGIIIIKSSQGDMKFTVPPFTASNAESSYQLPIVQEEEAEIIRNFFKNL